MAKYTYLGLNCIIEGIHQIFLFPTAGRYESFIEDPRIGGNDSIAITLVINQWHINLGLALMLGRFLCHLSVFDESIGYSGNYYLTTADFLIRFARVFFSTI